MEENKMTRRIIVVDNDSKVRNDLYAAMERANRKLPEEERYFSYTAGNASAAVAKLRQGLQTDWTNDDITYVFQDIMMDEGQEEGLKEIQEWDRLLSMDTSLNGRLTGLVILSSIADKVKDRSEVVSVRNFPVYAFPKRQRMGSYGPAAIEYLKKVIDGREVPLNQLALKSFR